MSVYTRTVFSGAIPTAQTVLYTVPSTDVFIVRFMVYDLFAAGAGAPLVGASLPGLSNGVLWQLASVPESVTQFWNGRVAIPGGGTIYASSPSSSNTLIICGYLFSS